MSDHRFSRRTLLGGAATGTAFTLLTDRADAAPAVGRTLASNLNVPWDIAFLPNGDGLVTERETGFVHRVSRRGGRTRVGVLGETDTTSTNEGGLLGVALSPTFATDRQAYFYLTVSGSENRIVRATYANGAVGPRTTILGDIPAGQIHNGGRIRFGPDRKLYVTTGDANDRPMAQDVNELGGKILRINADGSVPGDNPFPNNPVWTYGHRNVQGIAWDRRGRTWATELGQQTRDELNRIIKGDNYGWPIVEGGDGGGEFHDPFVTWSPTSSCSPSGLATRGNRAWVGALAGRALFAVDIIGARRGRKTRYFHNRLGRIRAVVTAPDGSLWITTSNRTTGSPAPSDDRVVRIAFR
jgi:glucose/arabinose dehydrogenase